MTMRTQPEDNQPSSRYRYHEFAETEFRRGSYYAVPFLVVPPPQSSPLDEAQVSSSSSEIRRHPASYSSSSLVTGVNNGGQSSSTPHYYLRTIPQSELSQLIRHHIAHQRRRLHIDGDEGAETSTNGFNNNNNNHGGILLEGVKRITELRQTPFRWEYKY